MHTSTPPPTPPPGSPPRSPGELRFHVGESEVTTAHGELLPRLADEPAADVGSAETNREIAERLEREIAATRAEMNREVAERLEREIAATRLKVNASPARDASLLAPKFRPPPPSPREGWRLEALRSPPKPDAIDEAAAVDASTRDEWLLRLLTCVVAVDGAGDAEAVRGGRFLLALYTLDTLSWAVAKMALYEVLAFARRALGARALVLASLAMTTAEVGFEFAAAALTPALFRRATGRDMDARRCAAFALDCYGASSAAAVVVYPAVYFGAERGSKLPWLVVAAVAQNVQYSFLNQVGDQACGLSRPHWHRTFASVATRWPPWRAAPPGGTPPERLAVLLTLARVVLSAALAALYVAARASYAAARHALVVGLSASVVACVVVLRRSGPGPAVPAAAVGEDGGCAPSLARLDGLDRRLVVFSVVVFDLPDQAFNAIVALLVLRLSPLASGAALVFGTLAAVAYLHAKLRRTARPAGGYGGWLALVAASAASLLCAAALIIAARDRALYLAVPPLVVYAASQQALFAKFTAFLFVHDNERSSLVNFYANAGYAAVAGPLLAVNWALAASAASLRAALATLLLVAVGGYALAAAGVGGSATLRRGVDGALAGFRPRQGAPPPPPAATPREPPEAACSRDEAAADVTTLKINYIDEADDDDEAGLPPFPGSAVEEEEARLVATTRHGSSWMLDVEHVVADLDDPGDDYADLQIQGVSYDDVATCSTNVCGLYC